PWGRTGVPCRVGHSCASAGAIAAASNRAAANALNLPMKTPVLARVAALPEPSSAGMTEPRKQERDTPVAGPSQFGLSEAPSPVTGEVGGEGTCASLSGP